MGSSFRRESSQMQKPDRSFILANSNELRRRAKSRGARGAPVQVTAAPLQSRGGQLSLQAFHS